jgi:hypothetical protein
VTDASFNGMAGALTEDNTDVLISTASKRGQVRFRVPSFKGSGMLSMSVDFLRMLLPGSDLGPAPVIKGKMTASFGKCSNFKTGCFGFLFLY